MILNDDFVTVFSEISSTLHLEDNELVSSLTDLDESLGSLYGTLSEELIDSVDGRDIDIDMDEWLFIVYLSKSINSFAKFVKDIRGSNILDDDFDRGSIALMKEYYSYGIFDTGKSLYLNVGESSDIPFIYIGDVREDGHVTNDNFRHPSPVPLNNAVAMVLSQEGIEREDIFLKNEMEYTVDDGMVQLEDGIEGYNRIKPEAIIDRLGVNRNGKLELINKIL